MCVYFAKTEENVICESAYLISQVIVHFGGMEIKKSRELVYGNQQGSHVH